VERREFVSNVEEPVAKSRDAMQHLLDLVASAQATYLTPHFNITSADDIAEGQRLIAHVLETGLHFWLEADPERPVFKPYVTTTRKLLGDNPDALYYFAPIRDDREYRIRGNLAGATFTSFTVETGSAEGHAATGSSAAIDDTEMLVERDGSFEIHVGRTRPARGNWLPLEHGAGQITSRHFFESRSCVAADPSVRIPLRIEPLDPPAAPAFAGDEAIARRLGYVANFVAEHLAMSIPEPASRVGRSWVSTVPNQFNAPSQWQSETGYGNLHAWYAMAPFVLGDGEALVIESRFPPCRFANLVLWNRFLQTFDYATHPASINRRQISYRDDGSFRLILAAEDPGEPNWLSTEGRPFGLMYWRWLLPTEAPPTPVTHVIRR
jgi:hypothetical protein